MEEAYNIHLQLQEAFKTAMKAISLTDLLHLKIKSLKEKESMSSPSSKHTRLCMLACLQEAYDANIILAVTKGEEQMDCKARLYELIRDNEELYEALTDSSYF